MIQNAVYTKDVYRNKKDYVIGVLYHGGDIAEAKRTPEIWLFDHGCVTWKQINSFLTAIYIF